MNVRTRDNKVHGEHKLTALLEVLARERATRSLTCCFEDEGSPEDAAPATTA